MFCHQLYQGQLGAHVNAFRFDQNRGYKDLQKFCRRSPKRSVTRAGTKLDGLYLIPSSALNGRISKHPAILPNIHRLFCQCWKTRRTIQTPCLQLIQSACIFKTVSLHVDFYSQVSAGTSLPSGQERDVTALSQNYSRQWHISLHQLIGTPQSPFSDVSELQLQ